MAAAFRPSNETLFLDVPEFKGATGAPVSALDQMAVTFALERELMVRAPTHHQSLKNRVLATILFWKKGEVEPIRVSRLQMPVAEGHRFILSETVNDDGGIPFAWVVRYGPGQVSRTFGTIDVDSHAITRRSATRKYSTTYR